MSDKLQFVDRMRDAEVAAEKVRLKEALAPSLW
jgi:hypothetical protein